MLIKLEMIYVYMYKIKILINLKIKHLLISQVLIILFKESKDKLII